MYESFFPVSVVRVQEESSDSKSYYLEISENLKPEFNYLAGQHIYLKTATSDTEHFRPYSITSSPSEKAFRITVKRFRGGAVSNLVNDHVKEGDTMEVTKPQGDFCLPFSSNQVRNHVFIGAGSGIAPLVSLIKETLLQEPQSSAFLLFGNRNEDSVIFREELIRIQNDYPDRFYVTFILSSPKRHRKPGLTGYLSRGEIKWTGLTGRIDEKTLPDFLKGVSHVGVDETKYYLCGPDKMIDGAKNYLLANGVYENDILSESFRREYENLLPGGKIDSCQLKLKYQGEVYNIEIDDQRPILDSLLHKQVMVPFSCKAGVCSSCVAMLEKGEINTRKTKGLKGDFLDSNFFLSCQSVPKTRFLEIDYDVTLPEEP